MPDEELLAHAAAGDLHSPRCWSAQARRMLRDDRVRGLATEFGGNWLDFRRFEEHNSVDRERFPAFNDELRQAMFEEPIRFFVDLVRDDRSVLDFLYGEPHVRQPGPGPALRHARARRRARRLGAGRRRDRYGRGGLLPMAVFLTKNSPGLRTSPVKRGYWVVRRLLGEHIPPPPPNVPELPDDEAKLGDADAARGAGPAPRRQELRRLPRAVRLDRPGLRGLRPGRRAPDATTSAAGRSTPGRRSPAAARAPGVDGLRAYLRDAARRTSSSTTCAASCWPTPSAAACSRRTTTTVDAMRTRLAADGYRFGSLVESDRHQPAVPEQAGRRRRRRSDRDDPTHPKPGHDQDRAVAGRPGGRSSAASA